MARFSFVFTAAGIHFLVAMALITETSTKTFTATALLQERRYDFHCYNQYVDQQHLSQCLMYLTPIATKGKWPQHEYLETCCYQLQKMGEDCRCAAVVSMMHVGGWMNPELKNLIREGRKLPCTCNLEPKDCDN